jgi:hypothetical protein
MQIYNTSVGILSNLTDVKIFKVAEMCENWLAVMVII